MVVRLLKFYYATPHKVRTHVCRSQCSMTEKAWSADVELCGVTLTLQSILLAVDSGKEEYSTFSVESRVRSQHP